MTICGTWSGYVAKEIEWELRLEENLNEIEIINALRNGWFAM